MLLNRDKYSLNRNLCLSSYTCYLPVTFAIWISTRKHMGIWQNEGRCLQTYPSQANPVWFIIEVKNVTLVCYVKYIQK